MISSTKFSKCERSSFFGRRIEKIALLESQNCHFLQNTCSKSFEIECNLFSFYRLQLLKGLVHFSIWLKKRFWIFYCHVDSCTTLPDGSLGRTRVLQNFTKMWLEILFVHSVLSGQKRNQDSLQSPWLFVSSDNAKRRGEMLNLRKYSRWISHFLF